MRAEGAPAGGARASLFPVQSSHEWGRMILAGRPAPEAVATAVVDAAGSFRLIAPSAGLWTVVAEAPGRVPVQMSPLAVVEVVELPPAILPEAAEVRVRVTAADGSLVFLKAPRERLTVQATADGAAAGRRSGFEGGDLQLPAPGGAVTALEVVGADGRRWSGSVALRVTPAGRGGSGLASPQSPRPGRVRLHGRVAVKLCVSRTSANSRAPRHKPEGKAGNGTCAEHPIYDT
jgi:hypothetical protein